MKKNILLLLFFALNLSILTAQSEDWIKIKDTVAAYIIEFPSKAIKGNQEVPTDRGPVTMNTYTLETYNDKNLIYMTSFTKYPDSFFEDKLQSAAAQERALDGSVNGAVVNIGGTLISDKKITFNGYKGRNFKIKIKGSSNSEYIVQMRSVLVGLKLYTTQVIYEKSNDENENSKHFFESFELINIKK